MRCQGSPIATSSTPKNPPDAPPAAAPGDCRPAHQAAGYRSLSTSVDSWVIGRARGRGGDAGGDDLPSRVFALDQARRFFLSHPSVGLGHFMHAARKFDPLYRAEFLGLGLLAAAARLSRRRSSFWITLRSSPHGESLAARIALWNFLMSSGDICGRSIS